MDNNPVMIPYFVHEGEASRLERFNKRLWVLIVLLVLLLVGSNVGWLIYESRFATETITESYEATADDHSNAILNGDGEVRITYGGESEVYEDHDSEGREGVQ